MPFIDSWVLAECRFSGRRFTETFAWPYVITDNKRMKMQRVVVKTSLHPQDGRESADLQYWLSKPVHARLAAVEVLRRQMGGVDAERRLQRVCRITALKSG